MQLLFIFSVESFANDVVVKLICRKKETGWWRTWERNCYSTQWWFIHGRKRGRRSSKAGTSSRIDIEEFSEAETVKSNRSCAHFFENKEAPHQSNLKDHPKTKFGTKLRRFSSDWYKTFEWLEYNKELGACFCFPCRVFVPNLSEKTFSHMGFVIGNMQVIRWRGRVTMKIPVCTSKKWPPTNSTNFWRHWIVAAVSQKTLAWNRNYGEHKVLTIEKRLSIEGRSELDFS